MISEYLSVYISSYFNLVQKSKSSENDQFPLS